MGNKTEIKPTVAGFLAQNKIKREYKYAASKNFVDENGDPLKWTLKPISADLNQRIQESPDVTETIRDRKTGEVTRQLNQNEYMNRIASYGVVEPNLDDPELRASYVEESGKPIRNRMELLKEMLDAGELANLALKVVEISGFSMDEDDLVSSDEFDVLEAKNL